MGGNTNTNSTASQTAFGYHAVAACMNCDRDLAIYRRFGVLNTRNLLNLQSELMGLENRLQDLDDAANNISLGNAVWSTPRSWHALERAGGEHLELVLKIRDRLEVYNRSLASHAWLLGLKKPDPRPMQNLEEYLRANSREMAATDAEFAKKKYGDDMVALATAEKEPMYKFLERWFYWLFEKETPNFVPQTQSPEPPGENGQMTRYSDGKIRNIVRILAVVGSSLLPILSIVALHFIHSQTARLGCIVAFCLICSVTLAALSNAKNVEIIAATAAYAAIQVVFVSGSTST